MPDVEESSEEESDAVSTASKSVKPKTGRRSQWTVDQIDDFIDIQWSLALRIARRS